MKERITLIAGLVLACASPPDGRVVVTQSLYEEIERGPYADLCAPLEEADSSIGRNDFARAEALVDEMIESFAEVIAKQPGRPVSVANQPQFEELQAAADGRRVLIPLDWCYRELLHRKAFLQGHRGDADGALQTLHWEAEIAPTSAAPFVERGYILNRLGRFNEARDAYEQALKLIDRYPPSRPQQPLALRGLGYSLIELGDLDGAEEAFNRSLEIDPDNELARHELQYIEKLRRRSR